MAQSKKSKFWISIAGLVVFFLGLLGQIYLLNRIAMHPLILFMMIPITSIMIVIGLLIFLVMRRPDDKKKIVPYFVMSFIAIFLVIIALGVWLVWHVSTNYQNELLNDRTDWNTVCADNCKALNATDFRTERKSKEDGFIVEQYCYCYSEEVEIAKELLWKKPI